MSYGDDLRPAPPPRRSYVTVRCPRCGCPLVVEAGEQAAIVCCLPPCRT